MVFVDFKLKSMDFPTKIILVFCNKYRRKATFFLHTICLGTCNVNIVINDSKQTKRSLVVCFHFHTPTAFFYTAERMDSVSFFCMEFVVCKAGFVHGKDYFLQSVKKHSCFLQFSVRSTRAFLSYTYLHASLKALIFLR